LASASFTSTWWTTNASSSSPLQQHGLMNVAHGDESPIARGKILATMEQAVEDYNAEWVASAGNDAVKALSKRRLICMPLDERFDPPMGMFSHGHVQTGDKMSLPNNFWKAITKSKAEVPWLMEVSRVEGVTQPRVLKEECDENGPIENLPGLLDRAIGGILDSRAPANYCFLPWWMMRALGLRPRDIVDVRLITTVPPGSMAKLRPHSSNFAKEIANPQAVLETELKHYSSLTKGSTIAFDYFGRRYWFDVEELRSDPRNQKEPVVKVQDCNLRTDFLPAKDTKQVKHQNRQREEE